MNKVLKVAALGATVIALATSASAADDLHLNIYGASAQGTFWNTYAKTFLTAPTSANGMGCASYVEGKATTIDPALRPAEGEAFDPSIHVSDDPKKFDLTKLGIAVGFNCAGNGNKNVYVRYTSNKSVEGPRAVMNQDPQNNDVCPLVGGVDKNRVQAEWNGVTGTGAAFYAKCLDVNIGASDVATAAFDQESHGNKNGTYNTAQFDEVLDPETIPATNFYRNPIIVPFAFFANNALSKNDFTRQQMLLIMSGNVYNWSQFGPGYESKKVVLCMRHAGSGTHATLDKAIMRGDATLPIDQNLAVAIDTKEAGVQFHESSSDMMNCINDNGGYNTATTAAIGYADADAIVKDYNGADGIKGNADDGDENKKSTATNVKRLKFNGTSEGMTLANKGTYGWSQMKNNIINGSYEFWSSQWMYMDDAQESTETENAFKKLATFASNTTLPCPGLGCYWLTGKELHVDKADDFSIPTLQQWVD